MKDTLNANEWVVMNALWAANEPVTLSETIQAIGDAVTWSYSTYAAYMSLLEKKGFIKSNKRGRDKFYSPAVSMSECVMREGRSVMSKVAAPAQRELLMCMVSNMSVMTDEEREKLRALIEELGE